MVQAKITANQVGIAVDVRQGEGDWQLLDLYPFKEYRSTTVMQYSNCIDPARQVQEIRAFLESKGVQVVSIR